MDAKFDHYLSFDNGVSGSAALVGPNGLNKFLLTPVFKCRSYTKEEKYINRVDTVKLRRLIVDWNPPKETTLALVERAMVNPRRFAATLSAIRALEATLIVLEELDFFIRYVDSKEWQSVVLPGIVGSDELKAASLKLGLQLYPGLKFKKDADSLLMARWAQLAEL